MTTEFNRFTNSSSDFVVKSAVSDKDMINNCINIYFNFRYVRNNVVVNNNAVTITVNLTVINTTTVNSTNTTLDDNLLELNSNATSNANDKNIIIKDFYR